MPLPAGTKLGPYEIEVPAGAGGMGEVYKARDLRLDRTVAIKILPSELGADPTLRQRLDREARTICRLSHPHICRLYDLGHQDGTDYLVMEYLEGETLDQRLQRGPLPVELTIRYGVEIAHALASAHKHGVVHRDLKPSNVMLTSEGAKLLDFGLAKQTEVAAFATSRETVEQSQLTAAGMIVGTLHYMAPEQLEGKEADPRTDIFALGEIIYEMATGQRTFSGQSRAAIVAAILSSEPLAMTSLKPGCPPGLDRVIRKCLAKDPEERWQSAADLASELSWAGEAATQSSQAAASAASRRFWQRAGWIVAAVALVAAITLGFAYLRRGSTTQGAMHFSIAIPSSVRDLSLSPNGRTLAFIAPRPNEGGSVLWLHEIGSTRMQVLESTEGASYPFWSADGRSLGFFADGKLKRMDAAGGPVQVICDAPVGRGGTWNQDNIIVFQARPAGGLSRVSASGGAVTAVTEVPARAVDFPNLSHRWPSFLPGGKHFLYSTADFADLSGEGNGIYVGTLGSKDQRRLLTSNSNAAYVPAGYLVFFRNGTLMAQRFDAATLELAGEAVAVANNVEYLSGLARAVFAVSQTGTLVYQTGSAATSSQLEWFDRAGKRLDAIGTASNYANPRISPDGKKVAFDIDDPQSFSTDVWVVDLEQGARSRFTFDPALDETPIWSPDGTRILWTSQRRGGFGFYLRSTTASAREDMLLNFPSSSGPTLYLPTDWSRDGRLVLYTTAPANWIPHLWTLSPVQEAKPRRFSQGEAAEMQGQFSPDGRWVAYSSNESGRWEVYVAPFPGPGSKYQVSTNGGQQPRWRRDGKELFFLSADKKLIAVPVTGGTTFTSGELTVLFQTRAREPLSAEEVFTYDVSADGQRFLINVNPESGGASPVNLVLNWTAGMQK